jgi:putative transposase
VSYRLVHQLHKEAFPIAQVCRALSVSRSGFYAALHRWTTPKEVCLEGIHLQTIFAKSGKTYGSRRLQAGLNQLGFKTGRYRVRSLMKRYRMKPVWKRKFVRTTDSKHPLAIADHLLNRQFKPVGPNKAWVSDITYIQTQSGFLYLAAVLDLYSRKLIGWAMAPNMSAKLVCSALTMALGHRQPEEAQQLMVHSDRGSQYTSCEYQDLLAKHGLRCSMSRKRNCWDNAVMERFFLSLKKERLWRKAYANHAEAIQDVTDYIVTFYNNERLHSTLGYLPPNVYERNMAA